MQLLHDLIVKQPWILAVWVFVVGSAIGSFLNVVIYRMPRGMSLSKPGSHCPRCGRPIRWYHNLPIAGWLILGGRCRDCGGGIPARYPLVELAVAMVFVAAAYLDVYAPTVEEQLADGLSTDSSAVVTQLGPRLLAWFAHVWTSSIAIAVLLIVWDAARVPWRLAIAAVVVAALTAPFLKMPAIWPLVASTCFAVAMTFFRNRRIEIAG